jgi:hypothetical protein
LKIKQLEWPFDETSSLNEENGVNLSISKMSTVNTTITDFVAKKNIDFMVVLILKNLYCLLFALD